MVVCLTLLRTSESFYLKELLKPHFGRTMRLVANCTRVGHRLVDSGTMTLLLVLARLLLCLLKGRVVLRSVKLQMNVLIIVMVRVTSGRGKLASN